MTTLPRVMLVTDRHGTAGRDLVDVVARAAEGGAGLIQVREKDLGPAALEALVDRILEVVPPGTRVLVNGQAEIARATGCGLHLPAGAPSPDRAGIPLLGRSAHDLEESGRAAREGVDYVVLGPVWPTSSKPGHPGAGTGLVSSIVKAISPLPVFAIGGVRPSRVAELRRSGVYGVAVRSAILAAPDPCRAARELLEAADLP